jgi:hypothetical protein
MFSLSVRLRGGALRDGTEQPRSDLCTRSPLLEFKEFLTHDILNKFIDIDMKTNPKTQKCLIKPPDLWDNKNKNPRFLNNNPRKYGDFFP